MHRYTFLLLTIFFKYISIPFHHYKTKFFNFVRRIIRSNNLAPEKIITFNCGFADCELHILRHSWSQIKNRQIGLKILTTLMNSNPTFGRHFGITADFSDADDFEFAADLLHVASQIQVWREWVRVTVASHKNKRKFLWNQGSVEIEIFFERHFPKTVALLEGPM